MNTQKLIIIGFFLVFFLFSCTGKSSSISPKQEISQHKNQVTSEQLFTMNLASLDAYTSKKEIQEIQNLASQGDFVQANDKIDVILGKISQKSDITLEDRKNKMTLTFLKIGNLLNEGNYSYKEKEKSKEAINLLDEIILQDPDFVDPFFSNYYLGYAQEIIKNYTGSLEYYNKALSYTNTDVKKNIRYISIIKNQIGHVYDLQGNSQKAYELYKEAYKDDVTNYNATMNIARYLTRIGDFKNAKKQLLYSLGTSQSILKSEIYFSLSSVELELGGKYPDIQQSIKYAKKSISYNPKYPMGYLYLAVGYYMLNDEKYDEQIKENLQTSISLNPNGTDAYRYFALYYLDKNDLEHAIQYVEKAQSVIDNDMILMDDQRIPLKYLCDKLMVYIKFSIQTPEQIFNLYDNENIEYFIISQLKRKDYGIYKNFFHQEGFSEILSYFNNKF